MSETTRNISVELMTSPTQVGKAKQHPNRTTAKVAKQGKNRTSSTIVVYRNCRSVYFDLILHIKVDELLNFDLGLLPKAITRPVDLRNLDPVGYRSIVIPDDRIC
jgi:hypothetical protein